MRSNFPKLDDVVYEDDNGGDQIYFVILFYFEGDELVLSIM